MNQALHHPFTAPNPEDMNDLPSARALAYDMIYNGVEVHPIFIFLVCAQANLIYCLNLFLNLMMHPKVQGCY